MDHFTNPAARDVIGHVLDTDPDGQILLAEAGHWRMLAQQSASVAAEAEAAEKTARRRCLALRHRLDPRNQRTMHVGVAAVALAAVSAALLGLDRIEFAVLLPGWRASAAAAAATAAWAGCAWLAALAVREERRGRLIAIAAGAAAVGLLLAALRSVGPAALRWPGWDPFWVSVLLVLVILALVTSATEIIRRTEPASLLMARRSWRRAREDHKAAVRVHRADAEAAVVAAQEWGSLIDAYAVAYAARRPAAGDPDGQDPAAANPPAGGGRHTPDPWPGQPPM